MPTVLRKGNVLGSRGVLSEESGVRKRKGKGVDLKDIEDVRRIAS